MCSLDRMIGVRRRDAAPHRASGLLAGALRGADVGDVARSCVSVCGLATFTPPIACWRPGGVVLAEAGEGGLEGRVVESPATSPRSAFPIALLSAGTLPASASPEMR
jgi:hypothetical protein